MTLSFVLSTSLLASHETPSPPASPDKSRSHPSSTSASSSTTILLVLSTSAVAAIFAASGSNATIALGLSYTILTSLAFILIDRARNEARNANTTGSVIYSANGFLSQPSAPNVSAADAKIAVIRDVAAASALATGVAAVSLESFTFGGLGYWGLFGRILGDNWVFWDGILGVVYAVTMVATHMGAYAALILLVCALWAWIIP